MTDYLEGVRIEKRVYYPTLDTIHKNLYNIDAYRSRIYWALFRSYYINGIFENLQRSICEIEDYE